MSSTANTTFSVMSSSVVLPDVFFDLNCDLQPVYREEGTSDTQLSIDDHIKDLPSLEEIRGLVSQLTTRVSDPDKTQVRNGGTLYLASYKRYGRVFTMTDDGDAIYEWRTGETITSVVTDLLSQMSDLDECAFEREEIAFARDEIIMANPSVKDFDLIEPGTAVLIPAWLLDCAQS